MECQTITPDTVFSGKTGSYNPINGDLNLSRVIYKVNNGVSWVRWRIIRFLDSAKWMRRVTVPKDQLFSKERKHIKNQERDVRTVKKHGKKEKDNADKSRKTVHSSKSGWGMRRNQNCNSKVIQAMVTTV
jgi:hypothetical protein